MRLCVCEREREKEKGREREKARERERERERKRERERERLMMDQLTDIYCTHNKSGANQTQLVRLFKLYERENKC